MADQRQVIANFDGVWAHETRWFSFQDVEMGPKGVSQHTVLYLLAVTGAVMLAISAPGLSGLTGAVPWWLWALLVPALTVALSLVRVAGLRAHEHAMPLARFLLGPKHLHGWVACASATGRWRPGDVVLCADGSDGRLPAGRYRGPGHLALTRPVTAVRDRRLARGRRLTLREQPGQSLTEPRVWRVPDGHTIALVPMERA